MSTRGKSATIAAFTLTGVLFLCYFTHVQPNTSILRDPEIAGNSCELPTDIADSLMIPSNTGKWRLWKSAYRGIAFRYPPDWVVREKEGSIMIVPPYSKERELPYRGDSDETFSIEITDSKDYNGIGYDLTEETFRRLRNVGSPIAKTMLFRSQYHPAIIVYCFYNYSEGISAIIKSPGRILDLSISRFAQGYNRTEDWETFAGILWTLNGTLIRPEATVEGQ